MSQFVARNVQLALTLALVAIGCSQPAFRFQVVFSDAGSLKVGDYVVHKGFNIGTVDSVELARGQVVVGLRVDEQYRQYACRESSFRISRPSLLDVTGARQVDMGVVNGTCTPIEPGETLRGFDGYFDEMLHRGGQALTSALREMETAIDKAARDLEAYAQSPEGQRLQARLQALGRRVEEMALATAEEAEKRWPAVEKELRALADDLRASGQEGAASELERQVPPD